MIQFSKLLVIALLFIIGMFAFNVGNYWLFFAIMMTIVFGFINILIFSAFVVVLTACFFISEILTSLF